MFENELLHIQNNEIVSFVSIVLAHAPNKFYYKPASSTGKYHPDSSQCKHGLINHTKQVFYLAKTIMDTKLDFVDCDRDVVLASCLLHDIYKYDENDYNKFTLRYHGKAGVKWIEELPAVIDFLSIYQNKPSWYYHILLCIHSHNGIFSKEYQGDFDIEQSIVHTADYIASQRWCYFDKEKLNESCQ